MRRKRERVSFTVRFRERYLSTSVNGFGLPVPIWTPYIPEFTEWENVDEALEAAKSTGVRGEFKVVRIAHTELWEAREL